MTVEERAFIDEAISKRRAQLERMELRRDDLQGAVSRLNRFIYGVKRELTQLLDVEDVVPEPTAAELGMSTSDFRSMTA